MQHLQQLFIALIDHYGYGGLFVAMAMANIGAPVGSEVILPVAGGLAATGHLPGGIWVAILVAVLAELAGAAVGYAIGRFGGRPLVDRYGKYVHVTHENLNRIHAFFERYGTFAIFICRFVPVIRGIVSIAAGIAEMDLAPFFLWYAAGSAIFCGALILLGNAAGDHLDSVLGFVHKSGLVVLGIAVVVAIAIFFVMRSRAKARTQTKPS